MGTRENISSFHLNWNGICIHILSFPFFLVLLVLRILIEYKNKYMILIIKIAANKNVVVTLQIYRNVYIDIISAKVRYITK